ncbi:hypothetical protein [Planomicrobium sp. YIM 101495]|uniref:hypothetical protein n=1 Tax=Planomicrobium sp. YIM 101495 TaxID=2665160 RepID=UPI0012B9358D|nr:hypothetical protein [Planomicrobium sp. YIM 101495]MTD30153.1 hypothetical protein [Planomicrobium sp. YIM 101495]
MDFKIYTQDGVIWTIKDVDIDMLKSTFANPSAQFINIGPKIMERKGNIAMVAPVLPEDATDNLFDVYLNTGTKVVVQAEDNEELTSATSQFNGSRGEFVAFAGALIGSYATQRITGFGAIKPE